MNVDEQLEEQVKIEKFEMWKRLTSELVDCDAVGHQFWGYIQACMDDMKG